MDNSSSTSAATLVCGACGQNNVGTAQFCAGCGHGLFEDCPGCGTSVALSQKFCVSCGKDLVAHLRERRQKQEKRLADAVELARSHQYDEAAYMLSKIAGQSDYRFVDLGEKATGAIDKIRQLEQKMNAGADEARSAAHRAYENNDLKEARRLLEMVPPTLMDPESKRILGHCRTHLDQVAELKRDLQSALEQKQYQDAGGYLDQLLELAPENPKFHKLATQVGEKLLKRANDRFAKLDYGNAMESLRSIPSPARNEQYQQTRCKIETVEWLTCQFPVEPFATSTLGRLAIRYQKEVPNDQNATVLVRKLSAAVKQRPKDRRSALPEWRTPHKSWLGGRVSLLASPSCVDFDEDVKLQQPVGQFSVALGLALQGLELGRVQQQLAEKKGFLSSFASKPKKTCWGIDVGASSIKAVLLRKDKGDEKPVVLDSYYAQLPLPTCRPGKEIKASDTLKAAVAAMLEEIEIGEAAVWVNLPAQEVVSRFVHLPPVKEKQAFSLLEQEAKQRIPIPYEDLNVVTWMGELEDANAYGRPAAVAAVTKSAAKRRLEQIEVEGLKVSGLQADPMALVNFATLEFSELIGADEPESDEDDDEAKATSNDEASSMLSTDAVPTVCLVDAGASKTTLLFVAANAFWYWTYESGGEDLTTQLARATKTVNDEAEELKRNPANLSEPGHDYEPVEEKQVEMRERLKKLNMEMRKEFNYFDVKHVWCVGKASLALGWIRRVLLAQESR